MTTIPQASAGGGLLEDAVLIATDPGTSAREVLVLGDVDLSALTRDEAVGAEYTVWWLMGHVDGVAAYTSTQDLDGTGLFTVEPYDIASPLDWDIPANLDAYASGGSFSADWWAQVSNNHDSHQASDAASATLHRFGSGGGTSGSALGTVTVDLHAPE